MSKSRSSSSSRMRIPAHSQREFKNIIKMMKILDDGESKKKNFCKYITICTCMYIYVYMYIYMYNVCILDIVPRTVQGVGRAPRQRIHREWAGLKRHSREQHQLYGRRLQQLEPWSIRSDHRTRLVREFAELFNDCRN
ncbi:hypothetical protein AAMO2058_001309100 [Amorphochlora amoebiformis]